MIGDRLYELRKDAGLTQDQLGEIIQVNKHSISSYERDKSEPPKVSGKGTGRLERLHRLFGTEVSKTTLKGVDCKETTMDTRTAVSNRLLALCESRNITVNRLGTISGVTQSTINNIVSGRNHSTTIATLKKLCDGLDISITEFFEDELFRNLEQEIK